MSPIGTFKIISPLLGNPLLDLLTSHLVCSCAHGCTVAHMVTSVPKKCFSDIKLYNALKSCTSVQMRKKMIASDITVAMVIDAYKKHGFDGLSRLFSADKNGKIRVRNNRNVKNRICDYLKTKY